MNQPFEPNKNAKELGIDVTKKFVIVTDEFLTDEYQQVGDIVTLDEDDNSSFPFFINQRLGARVCYLWKELAYADEGASTPETIEVGDIVEQKPEPPTALSINRTIIQEVYEFTYENVTLTVKIDHKNQTIALVDTKQNFNPQNFIFRGSAVLADQWLAILKAMELAIEDAKERLNNHA